ncbi:MAG: hypothetical protein PHH04_06490 [Thomasclavelia sp.]|nr:hypothetical protein [Tissierellia bacterium]MDD8049228.1 hypothetical protein [Thomasclavelia sp.]
MKKYITVIICLFMLLGCASNKKEEVKKFSLAGKQQDMETIKEKINNYFEIKIKKDETNGSLSTIQLSTEENVLDITFVFSEDGLSKILISDNTIDDDEKYTFLIRYEYRIKYVYLDKIEDNKSSVYIINGDPNTKIADGKKFISHYKEASGDIRKGCSDFYKNDIQKKLLDKAGISEKDLVLYGKELYKENQTTNE